MDNLEKELPEAKKSDLMKLVADAAGIGSLRSHQVKNWIVPRPKRKTGPKVNELFEAAVLDELVFETWEGN